MRLEDINETILKQLDPDVAISIIQAQQSIDIWDTIYTIAAIGFMLILIYIGIKYS